MANDREKTAYLTLLSVVSMIAVVILHANGCFWGFSTERYWITANVIECVFYFAVPIFFMITGATLLDYRERYDTRTFLKKRVNKTLIPFLVWSLFGLLFRLFILKDLRWEELGVSGAVNGILNTTVVDVYWFFLSLFVLYAVIPLLSLIPAEKKTTAFGWGALVLLFTSSFMPFVLNVFNTGIHWSLDPGSPVHFVLYLFLGYYLSHRELSRPWRITACVLALVGLLAHILGTYYLSMQAGGIVGTFKGYINLPCAFYSIGIFLFAKTYGNRLMKAFPGKVIRLLAPHCFTVYLLHWYMLRLIQKVFVHYGVVVDLSLWYRLGAVLVIVPACMLVDWVVRKIPVLKHTLPS